MGALDLAAFLSRNGVSSILYSQFSDCFSGSRQLDALQEKMRERALADAASYLSQKKTLSKINEALGAAHIRYAVFKGALVRETLYKQPWLRPTLDIDILVATKDKTRAIKALEETGMRHRPNPEVLSHETSLIEGNVNVDLHWNVMRPGRTRMDMTDSLLEGRVLRNGYQGMNPTASMFVLLVHPAISKYVCSPDATLIKMIDVYLSGKNAEVDWQKLVSLIDSAGLRTAAWATFFWLHLLLAAEPFESLATELQPGRLQSSYIAHWISNDLPTRFYTHRNLMRTAFSLSLHDRPSDIYRAIVQLLTHKHDL